MSQQKKIAILGSTGSIGVNTLDVVEKFSDKFEITALTANNNIDLIEAQIKKFKPSIAVIGEEEKARKLSEKIGDICSVLYGAKGLNEMAKETDYDILVSSLVGFAGLSPTIEGIKRGKRIALANKETLVAAGEYVMKLAEKHNSEIIPVDSEHSAIFQTLVGEDRKNLRKIILTASGGPFFSKTAEELKSVTIEEALNHPNWSMGNKVTIDSATMMNKGLEMIEARWLFNLPKEKIEPLIHPQSIIHSMVEFNDGSIKAQLSMPDMRLPIQYALSYPERLPAQFVDTDFAKLSALTFHKPDYEKFRCLQLAFDVMEQGGLKPCIMNAANEIAVDKFLNGQIKFSEIPDVIESALEKIEMNFTDELETIFECDRLTRELFNQ
ncbi:MAG: 1-deoxy-D-xylulose-5-phosphate reductoisomerase [Chlorobi bacterium]|nr:1-deoxy-D-xylulose-5-phosphate reductoisomerase [Chlorobiota bacterium]